MQIFIKTEALQYQKIHNSDILQVFQNSYLFLSINGKGKSHIRSVRWGVPVREDTYPEPSVFWGLLVSLLSDFVTLLYRLP